METQGDLFASDDCTQNTWQNKDLNWYPENALETRQLVYVDKKHVLVYSGHFFFS